MDIDRLINNLNTRILINKEEQARYELTAKTYPESHSTYTELAEWARGKVAAYETAIEMIREEAQ